jgi:type I restriction enzyme S subunit
MIDRNGTGMTAKGIKASKLKPLAIPFPPIEEQDRIVDKVQQLDAICASLASRLKQAEETKLNLADGLVRQASEIAA